MHIRPICLATAAKPLREIQYHEVAVPSCSSVQAAFAYAEELEMRLGCAEAGDVDVTAFVDLSLRFACLAYRRNAAQTITCTAIDGDCVEGVRAGR